MEKLKNFIEFSQKTGSQKEIKNEYLKLVKEFHPDINTDNDFSTANEIMIQLNYIYGSIINKTGFSGISVKEDDEYKDFMENGKYWYINTWGRKEYVSDKAFYLYKLALMEVYLSQRVLTANPLYSGKGEESLYMAIMHLHKAYVLANKVIKLSKDNIYANTARILLNRIYRKNKYITGRYKKFSASTELTLTADREPEERKVLLCYGGCPQYKYSGEHSCEYYFKFRKKH